MHPRFASQNNPDKPAIIMAATGQTVTYGELVSRSNKVAQLLRRLGLREGDGIAVLIENHPRYYDPVWAALNSALYVTTLSTHFTPREIAYVVNDCGAKVVFTSLALAERLAEVRLQLSGVEHVIVVDGAAPGAIDLEAILPDLPDSPLPDERQGAFMVYSSGTTGQPKGIRPVLPDLPVDVPMGVLAAQLKLFPIHADTVYLSPAPLFHTAPLKWNLTVQLAGGTCVVMERFDAELSLALIQRYRVTLAQFVPTMFVRMLALPEDQRTQYELSSLECVVHAAAPCPSQVKRRMIEWFGPIIDEYYAASESNGLCMITCAEWLERPGSVGRSKRGPIHIMSADGEAELPIGQEGLIYFEGGTPFVYHNDPEKTAAAHNSRGWSAVGDIGRLDEAGYLYITDRAHDLVISGGVNIYPREIEDLLSALPFVADVAVIGTPHAELGEELLAVIELVRGTDKIDAEARLRAYCREELAGPKRPRVYDFVPSLPRLETGKLLKRKLRESYRRPELAG